MADFSTLGALIGLAVAIVLIFKKFHPAYSLILGALIGGIAGGGGLDLTVNTMVSGAQSMMSSVLRILTSGILAGTLIKTGAAEEIAETIVTKLGEKRAIAAISIATMIICAVGVFVDISVITVAPIALGIGKKAGYHKPAILLASISAKKSLTPVTEQDLEKGGADKELPSFLAAICGPVVVIILLALRPIAGISVDPLIALPVGGLICAIATGNTAKMINYAEFGLSKVVGVSVLLVGTGTIAGIIKASALQYDVIHVLELLNMPAFILAPLAGILMGAAAASTTAGATIAAQTFAPTLIASGVSEVSAGAMIHAGATVVDSLPHGSFFHATGGSVNMGIKERMALIPYEACVGLSSTIVSVILYLIGM